MSPFLTALKFLLEGVSTLIVISKLTVRICTVGIFKDQHACTDSCVSIASG